MSDPPRGGYFYPDQTDGITGRMIHDLAAAQGEISQVWDDEEQRVLLGLGQRVLDLPSPRTLLDIGAGHGRVAFPLSSSFSGGVLVEPDPARRAVCAARADALGLGGRGFSVVAGMDALDAGDTFDVVVLGHVLQHVPTDDVEDLLGLAASRVKPGGLLYVAACLAVECDTYAVETLGPSMGWVEEPIDRATYDALAGAPEVDRLPVHFFPRSTLTLEIEATGLSVEQAVAFHRCPVGADGQVHYRDIAVFATRR